MAEKLYPVAAVAELWHCSPDHIYHLIAQGQLAATQLSTGRAKTRIAESELAAYVKRNTSRPSAKGRVA